MISKGETIRLMKELNINQKIIPVTYFMKAVTTEMEHIDVIGNDTKLAAMIAIAHLREDPKYYTFLWKQEKKRETYWEQHDKPSIFNIDED